MGTARFDANDWDRYSTRTTAMPTAAIYTAKTIDNYLDPKNIAVRESRDSDVNPNSTPVALFLDVTGSMGVIADQIAKKGLGTTFQEILNRKPISDPHILIGGIGDIRSDRSPLQATQFEAGVPEITSQIERIFLEHGGGNNDHESYDLAWWFAAMKTATDAFEKRGKKGYLFTIGDEGPPESLPARLMRDKVGDTPQADLPSREALEMAERTWEVFHIVVEQGSYCRRHGAENVAREWVDLLGERVIRLSDISKLGEVIVATIEVNEGRDKDAVAKSYGTGTDLVVARAVSGITTRKTGGATGLVRL